MCCLCFFFFKQKTAYEMRISDWSSDVCSSDLKNGSRTEFDPLKLQGSLQLALRKRPVSAEAMDAAIHRIEQKLLSSGEREVMSGQIGELVMRELKKLDKIGYIRFASVYKSFEDIAELDRKSTRLNSSH